MKNLLLLVVFLLFSGGVSAKGRNVDIIHLKNGAKIQGQIVSLTPGEKVTINTTSGHIFEYDFSEVSKIINKEQINKLKSFEERDKSGYYGTVQMGMGLGFGYIRDVAWPSISVINGYRFNNHFILGLGVGVNFRMIHYGDNTDTPIPIFIHGRVNLLSGKTTPYIAQDYGYSINAGRHIESSLGVAHHLSSRNSITLSVGWNQEEHAFLTLSDGTVFSEGVNSLIIRAGISF